jgi:hypothetical protein
MLGPQINGNPRLEHSPSVSPDGQKLYYTRGDGSWNIWVASWDSSLNDWVNPALLPYPVNTNGHEFTARIGPDGNHLYFSSSGVPPDSLFPNGRCGLFVSEWNGSSWSVPQPVGTGYCPTSDYPSITADGRWFYLREFVSDGTSSFVTHWNGSVWGPLVDLRPQIGARSGSPWIVPSGDTLFLQTPELPGFGNSDIWLMERRLTEVPTLEKELLLLLVLFLALGGVIWIRGGKPIT